MCVTRSHSGQGRVPSDCVVRQQDDAAVRLSAMVSVRVGCNSHLSCARSVMFLQYPASMPDGTVEVTVVDHVLVNRLPTPHTPRDIRLFTRGVSHLNQTKERACHSKTESVMSERSSALTFIAQTVYDSSMLQCANTVQTQAPSPSTDHVYNPCVHFVFCC